jgi:hypothetical protein
MRLRLSVTSGDRSICRSEEQRARASESVLDRIATPTVAGGGGHYKHSDSANAAAGSLAGPAANLRPVPPGDPVGPSVKWKRPISVEESIAAIDWPIAYLVGNGISALDLKSRKLLWSTKIPDQEPTLRPLLCPDHVYMAKCRGLFDIDPANGGVRRLFRGANRESSGGRLLLAGDKLICVSDTAVTAYPIRQVKPRNHTAQNH